MLALKIFPFLLHAILAKLVINLTDRSIDDEIQLHLKLEIANFSPLSICIRYKNHGEMKRSYLLDASDSNSFIYGDLRIVKVFNDGFGYITVMGEILMFYLSKIATEPRTWHHFCIGADLTQYKVVEEGKLWYQGHRKGMLKS